MKATGFWLFLPLLFGFSPSLPAATGPSLVYSTFLGGSTYDGITAVASDAAGNTYVAGFTGSADFPVTNQLNPGACVPRDLLTCVFVTKFNPAGQIVYAVIFGGSFLQSPSGIAIDSAGNAYVTGTTRSFDFPTVNAFQSTDRQPVFPGALGTNSPTGFVAKLNAAGTALVYSTYLGGSVSDLPYAIAVDAAGEAYIAGEADSQDFPVANAAQSTGPGAFVTKFNAAGTALVFSTFLGSSATARAIAVDAAGNAYVGGQVTGSFPTLNPIQATYGHTGVNNGAPTGFVTKYSAAGAVVYSTYLGGSVQDIVFGIAVSAAGNAYVCGTAQSPDFPTVQAIQPKFAGTTPGATNAFVSEINAAGSALVFSTYWGGSASDTCQSLAVDSLGDVYFAGQAASSNFPLNNSLQASLYPSGLVIFGQPTQFNPSPFLTKFAPGGGQALYSTLFGSGNAAAVALDGAGNAFLAVGVASYNFPVLNAAFPAPAGAGDGVLAKISDAAASSCSFFVTPSLSVSSIANSFKATVTANMGTCSWQASSNASWITSTPASGAGIAQVMVGVAANSGLATRSGAVQFAGASLTVNQTAPNHVDAGSASGAAGQIARVPITLNIDEQSPFFGVNFNVSVTPVGSAPTITSAFSFQPVAAFAAPSMHPGPSGTTAVVWSSFWPQLTQTVQLGELIVPIPASAVAGQTYQVSIASGFLPPAVYANGYLFYMLQPGVVGTITVGNPSPVVSWLYPSSAAPGSAGGTVTVNGQGFDAASTVLWNGSVRPTAFVSETQLQVSISAADSQSAGIAQVSVVNPTPGGGTSSALAFLITSAAPAGIGANGVVDGADYKIHLAGGGLASLFGTNLTASTVFASSLPLPFTLGGTQVLVDGIPAALLYVSPGQINFQMPWRTLGEQQASIVVTVNGVSSVAMTVPLTTYAPAIFTLNSQGTGQGAIQDSSTGTFVAPVNSIPGVTSQPTAVGKSISIYCTGLGAVGENVSDGNAAAALPTFSPMSPLMTSENIKTTTAVQATVGGISATVTYSGLAPGFAGLYQVNVTIPAGVQSGSAVPVVLTMNGVASNTATIAIQ